MALHAPEASRLASPRRRGHAQAHEDAFVLDTPSLAASAAQSQRARCNWRGTAAAGSIPNCDARRCCASARPRRRRSRSRWTAKRRATAWRAGRLRDRDPDLRQGDWLGRRELLGRVVSAGPLQVVAVPEDALPRLRAGQTARFIADGGAGPDLDLRVRSIDQDATRVLQEAVCPPRRRRCARVAEPALPERPVYRVMLDVESADPRPGAPAQLARPVSIHGDWEAPGACAHGGQRVLAGSGL